MAASDTLEQAEQNRLLQRLVDSMFVPEYIEDNFEVIEIIGKGGFGIVKKVKDLSTGELGAMKTLPFDPDGKANRNLKREFSTIAKLRSHENIVRLLHVFRGKDNKLHMVMELCDEDLTRYMATEESQWDSTRLSVARQVARGLEVLHSQNPPIVHRDIKPQNILIVKGPSANDVIAKLADFGISTSEIDASSTNTAGGPILLTNAPSGTEPYMPPECYAAMEGVGLKDGKFCFDASLDIFALGLVYLYIFCYNDSRYGELDI